MEQDCEYYRNIVERMTSVLGPHMLDSDSLPGNSDMDLDFDDDDDLEYERARTIGI